MEVRILVAARTSYLCVFTRERKRGLAMREAGAGLHILEAVGVVATVAAAAEFRILKSATMGVVVAILAPTEFQTLVFRGSLSSFGRMTLAAGDGLMQPREGESSLRVIEPGNRLPGFLIVATRAGGAELASMLILMTSGAFASKPQKRPGGVLHFEDGHSGGLDLRRIVTGYAVQRAMLALQREPRLRPMIELLAIQLDQRKVLAVVFRVASGAVFFPGRALKHPGMVTGVSVQPLLDLGVALHTFQRAGTRTKVMTGGARGHALQLLVRMRQRSGRYLSRRNSATQ